MNQAVALILAGDRYHQAQDAFQGVSAALEPAGYQVHHTTQYATFEQDLAGKSVLVIHRDGIEFPNGLHSAPVQWMQPHQESAVEQFVLNGGGFLALHNAGWNYPFRDGYRRTLGGYYIGHPEFARFHVEVVNDEHPVTSGVSSYDIEDEQHWLYWDYDRVTPLLVNPGQDGRQSVCGWAYTYGKGRVVYLPHGHTLVALLHPMVQHLLQNAGRWLLSGS